MCVFVVPPLFLEFSNYLVASKHFSNHPILSYNKQIFQKRGGGGGEKEQLGRGRKGENMFPKQPLEGCILKMSRFMLRR